MDHDFFQIFGVKMEKWFEKNVLKPPPSNCVRFNGWFIDEKKKYLVPNMLLQTTPLIKDYDAPWHPEEVEDLFGPLILQGK